MSKFAGLTMRSIENGVMYRGTEEQIRALFDHNSFKKGALVEMRKGLKSDAWYLRVSI